MQSIIAVVTTVAQLLPALIQFVTSLEAAIPQGGQGAVKLEILKSLLVNAYAVEKNLAASFEQIWPVVSGIVAKLVSTYNSLGIFKKG